LASIKELLSDAAHQTLTQHLATVNATTSSKTCTMPTRGEGIAAFLEKRAPRYE
jgi:enoyl-CoA hydratase/carnithine racemase